MMKRLLSSVFLIASSFAIGQSSVEWAKQSMQEDIQKIDAQLDELRDMKRGYDARALRAEDQADRLQFEDHYVLETRRYYQIAEENRAKARRVQEEIDRLEAQKAKLQQKA
jgi:type I restriction-modification system DNA methylase subunit